MKVVHLLSGGLDSAVALKWLLKEGHSLRCMGINYGQRHLKEIESAKMIAADSKVPFEVADLSGIQKFLSASSQTNLSIDVPEGHYASDNMKSTVVPNRNMIMLSVAIGWAVNNKDEAVCYAAHSGDHSIYPDCRPDFAEAVDRCAQLCDWHSVRLLRPFIEMTKTQIVKLGHELQVPFSKTWSCYKGGQAHCGKCGTCVERKEAFLEAGLEDPTEYES